MNNIVIYITTIRDFGFFKEIKEGIQYEKHLNNATRFPDMKTAIHKADELRKAGYETQTLLIL